MLEGDNERHFEDRNRQGIPKGGGKKKTFFSKKAVLCNRVLTSIG